MSFGSFLNISQLWFVGQSIHSEGMKKGRAKQNTKKEYIMKGRWKCIKMD
jgi:hypothetical protein